MDWQQVAVQTWFVHEQQIYGKSVNVIIHDSSWYVPVVTSDLIEISGTDGKDRLEEEK